MSPVPAAPARPLRRLKFGPRERLNDLRRSATPVHFPTVRRRRDVARSPVPPPVWMTSGEAKKPGPRVLLPRHPWKGRRFAARPHAQMSLFGGQVLPATMEGYLSAMDGISAYVNDCRSRFPSFADLLVGYVEEAHSMGFATKTDVSRVLTALNYFVPELQAGGHLKLAYKALGGWDVRAPSISWKPMPKHVCDLLALRLLEAGRADSAVALVLSFHCYLRGGEVFKLRVNDLLLPGNPSQFDPSGGSVRLRKPKTDKKGNQSVIIDDAEVCILLSRFLAWRERAHGAPLLPGEPLFRLTPGQLLADLKWVQIQVGYSASALPFVRHSLRHGGATYDWAGRLRKTLDVMIRGRWRSEKSLRRYLQAAEANLMSVEVPPLIYDFFTANGSQAFMTRKAWLALLGFQWN